MKILYIHTCRTDHVLETIQSKCPSVSDKIDVIKYNHPWNFMDDIKEKINKHADEVDMFFIEFSSLKKDQHSSSMHYDEYKEYVEDIITKVSNKPCFITYNINTKVSPQDITPGLRRALDGHNYLKSRRNLEGWTTHIFTQQHKGPLKIFKTGDIFPVELNESKYLWGKMNVDDSDTRHYGKQRIPLINYRPKEWSLRILWPEMLAFIFDNLKQS